MCQKRSMVILALVGCAAIVALAAACDRDPTPRTKVGPATFEAPHSLELSRREDSIDAYRYAYFTSPGESRPGSRRHVWLVVGAYGIAPPYPRLPVSPFGEVVEIDATLALLQEWYGGNELLAVKEARAITIDGETGFQFSAIVGGDEVTALAMFKLHDGRFVSIEYRNRGDTSTAPFDDVLDSLELSE